MKKNAPGCNCCCTSNQCLNDSSVVVDDPFTQITITTTAYTTPDAIRYLGYLLDGTTKYVFSMDMSLLDGDYVINFDEEQCLWETLEGSISTVLNDVIMRRYVDDCRISTVGAATTRNISYQMIFDKSKRKLVFKFEFSISSTAVDFLGNLIFPTLTDTMEFTAEVFCNGGSMTLVIDNAHPNDDPMACGTYPPPDDTTATYVLS